MVFEVLVRRVIFFIFIILFIEDIWNRLRLGPLLKLDFSKLSQSTVWQLSHTITVALDYELIEAIWMGLVVRP